MSVRHGLFIAALLFLTAPPVAVHAQAVSAATRQQIAARYARYDRLDAGRDMQAVQIWYLENTTGDYAERRPDGRVTTRRQVLGSVRQLAALRARGAGAGIRLRSRTALLRLARRGAGAVADTKVTVTATVPPARGRAAATVTTVETHRDLWTLAAGRWRIQRRDVLTHSAATTARR